MDQQRHRTAGEPEDHPRSTIPRHGGGSTLTTSTSATIPTTSRWEPISRRGVAISRPIAASGATISQARRLAAIPSDRTTTRGANRW